MCPSPGAEKTESVSAAATYKAAALADYDRDLSPTIRAGRPGDASGNAARCRGQSALTDRQALGLAALVAAAALGVVAGAGDAILELGAGVVLDAAVDVEDGEAAAAAIPVTLIGNDEVGGVEPGHAVGLAGDGMAPPSMSGPRAHDARAAPVRARSRQASEQ
mgnify:CR=1 FL=1